jgi:TatD DNase family protein
MKIIDTHAHLDGAEFQGDLSEVIARAEAAGIGKVFIPGIDASSIESVRRVCNQFPGFCYGMIGLQPEEVKEDYKAVLDRMYKVLKQKEEDIIAVGEVGLDFYWSREFESEQLDAFDIACQWSVEIQLPLMIHCRKAQNELLHIMSSYKKELPGGVFHCFTGNQKEAERFLEFDRFVLGVGGVLTFKSSHLRDDLPAVVPLDRIVLETDSPYMAPVPHRGKRNESAFIVEVLHTLASAYGVSDDDIARQTNANVARVFDVKFK